MRQPQYAGWATSNYFLQVSMGTTNRNLLTSLFTKSDQAPKPQVRQTAWPVCLPAPTLATGSQLLACTLGSPACTPCPPSAPFMWSLMWAKPYKAWCWGLPPKELPHCRQMKKNTTIQIVHELKKKRFGKEIHQNYKIMAEFTALHLLYQKKKVLHCFMAKKCVVSKSILYLVFVCGHAEQLVGSQFLDQGLNPDHGTKSTKSEPLDCQGTPLDLFKCIVQC